MFKRKFAIFYLFLAIIVSAPTQAANQTEIKNSINQLLAKHPNLNTGIAVYSLKNDKIIYQKNPNQLFTPASTLKNFTAIAALTSLGPDYKFQTKILTPGKTITNGTLNNDLYFYFDGDPTLTKENISDMVKNLTNLGIKKVVGNLYIDDTIFDNATIGAGWMWEDLNLCFAAPISGAIIDKNCVSFKIQPTINPKLAIAAIDDDKNRISISSDIKIDDSENCALKLQSLNGNNYYISGCLKPDSLSMDLSLSLNDVRLYIKSLIPEKLKENGIKLSGKTILKKTPAISLKTLAKHQSEPLSEIIKPLLKNSDNTIADAIYKKLGNAYSNNSSSWKDGATAVANILAKKVDIDFSKMYMDDGSGLSRYDLITPMQQIKLLKYAYFNKNINPYFIDALPTPSEGTLENRMINLKDRIYAKTGSMKSISSLAGYIKTKNHDTVALVIVFNSFLGDSKEYRDLQDRICEILANS
jgi:D-alanyl-D-alanine carboxypeptidase/D-alanyl-D-alanine-endopeptidase (penicillin-binding protein 4)